MAAAVLRFAYLYAAPLIRNTPTGGPKPVDALNWQLERNRLKDVVRGSKLGVHWLAANATVDNIRSAVTMGCTVIHYTGHGDIGSVTFEDDDGIMYVVEAERFRALVAAGDGAAGA
jgi:hypothetical protein